MASICLGLNELTAIDPLSSSTYTRPKIFDIENLWFLDSLHDLIYNHCYFAAKYNGS